MKVLLITNLCLSKSAALPDRNLITGLHSKGVDLTIITQGPIPEPEDLKEAGINLIYLKISKKIDIPAIGKIRSLLKKENFDILHFTYGKAITNGLIASRGFDVKIIAYLGSLSLHWHDPFSYISFLNHRIDKLICVSDGVLEHVLKQSPYRMKNKIVRIYRGADPEWFKDAVPVPRQKLGIPDDAFVVCCVANIRKIKGLDWLIKAADLLPENLPVWFLLVGDKTDTKSIRRKISRTGRKKNFITIGYSDNPILYTSLCDLYIQPSVSEGFGRSLIEAMCLRKPIVVTDKGGAKELVKEDITGFIIPGKSADAIAGKIIYCYYNRDKLQGMGEKARESVINDFNHQTTIESTYNLYRELLGG
jgi:glycosyltransferase involved in cell wall biosynthesis